MRERLGQAGGLDHGYVPQRGVGEDCVGGLGALLGDLRAPGPQLLEQGDGARIVVGLEVGGGLPGSLSGGLPALTPGGVSGSVSGGPQAVQEAGGLPGGPASGVTGARVGDDEVLSRAGDAHIKQAPLLLDGGLSLGQGDRQQALAGAREDDGVPLQALGGVQGGEGDALDGGGVLGVGALSQLGVPLSVIIAVWPDPSWRKYLADVIVSDGSITGFFARS